MFKPYEEDRTAKLEQTGPLNFCLDLRTNIQKRAEQTGHELCFQSSNQVSKTENYVLGFENRSLGLLNPRMTGSGFGLRADVGGTGFGCTENDDGPIDYSMPRTEKKQASENRENGVKSEKSDASEPVTDTSDEYVPKKLRAISKSV